VEPRQLYRRTVSEIGSPTQKMWVSTAMAIAEGVSKGFIDANGITPKYMNR